jgi:hypothetical protein
MIIPKFLRVFIAITCLALLSPGAALAASGEGISPYAVQQPMDMGMDTPVSDLTPEKRAIDEEWQLGYPSEELYQKHREIDKYVFKDHADEIRLEGFGVTHTGPRDGFIEIGITPYSEGYADYLYEIFGGDMVRVVEGRQAVTLPLTTGEEPDVEVDAGRAEDDIIISKDLGVGVRLNGRMLSFDVEPFIENDRVLIPLRGVMEGLGADVEWDQQTGAVSVFTKDVSIQLVIGENTAKVVKTVDGATSDETAELDVAAKLVNDRTFIPVRFVSETLGANVEWDSDLRIVIIEAEDKDQEQTEYPGEDEAEPDKLSLKNYFPLTGGSTWKYLGEGNEYASFSREVLFVDGDRSQVSEDNGGTVSASVFGFEEGQIVRTFFRGEEYDGNNLLDEEANDDLVLLKAPLEAGTKWETSNGVREIIGTGTEVDTPAGKFEDCIKIEITTEHSVMYEYYKEGIGLVKREFLTEGMNVTSTLKEYNIK